MNNSTNSQTRSNLPTILTGDRPTGALHIGHYFGSLVNRKALENDYNTFLMVADVQALTDNYDNPTKVRDNVLEVAMDNMALGLNLDQTSIFIQSQIPQIAELTVFFSNLVSVARLQRNPTIKTEISQKKELFGNDGESVTYGFLGYPVSQAADILFLRANCVPVGEDQLPVIEVCRDIVSKFNGIYGDIFPMPEAKLSSATRILGLDGNAKMSKSLGNAVYLKDTPSETLSKIKSAKTDSGNDITFDPKTRPEVSNLVLLYSLVNGISVEQSVSDLANIRFGAFKTKLGEDMNNYFAEFRANRLELENNVELVKSTLEIGRQRVLARAEITMNSVRRAMKIDY
jgi:tryptophanyl-tRNA synthetase